MVPKIGMTTKSFGFSKWYKEMQDSKCKVIEINKRSVKFYLIPKWIEKIKPYLKGFDLSLHSGTTKVFTKNKQFTKTELEMLKSEILICEMLGIKEFVFHLKNEKLDEKEASQIREIINFAKQKKIKMIYESNGLLVGDIALDFLKRFPDVNYNLDLGHLNNALGNNMLGYDIDDFINKIKDRVIYVHAHSNNSKKDEHKALRDGNLDWKKVLDLLDLKKVKRIMSETRTQEDDYKNLEDLKTYLNKKSF